jgi:hypothetical protein
MRVSPAVGSWMCVTDFGKFDVYQQVMIGRPYPAFADAELGQTVINFAGLVAVGVAVDPCLDGVAVLW